MLKISIVTPSFNSAKFIEDCIQSVLNQNYPNFEHMIIDGGSTDGTQEILKKYPHLSWISESDRGQSDALNKGFNLARGDIIGWLNSDDYFLENAFLSFNNSYECNKNGDYYYGDYFIVDYLGNPIRLVRPIRYDFKIILHYGPFIPSSGSFFKKDLILEGFQLDVNHHYNMDRKFLLDLGYAEKKIIYINKPLSCFRVHQYNVSNPSSSVFSRSARNKAQDDESDKVLYSFCKSFNNHHYEKIRKKLFRIFYRIKFLLIRIYEWKYSKNMKELI